MDKQAQELKRLIVALSTEELSSDLSSVKKPIEKSYEILNGYDLQSELDYIQSTLRNIDYDKKEIGKLCSEINEQVNETSKNLLELSKLVASELDVLKEEQDATEEVPRFPTEETIDEETKEDIITEIMQEE